VKMVLRDCACMRTPAPPKRRKPPADRSVALQPSLVSSLGDHSYASADVSHAPMAITVDDHDYQDVCAGILLVSLQFTKCGVARLVIVLWVCCPVLYL